MRFPIENMESDMKYCVFIAFLLVIVCVSFAFSEEFGVRKKTPKASEFGNVVMNNSSGKNNQAPVVFNHWLHRAIYTCRVCHVDLGFGMQEGSTGVTMEDNKKNLYCGACHDGKEAFAPERKDLLGNAIKNCDRCHSLGKKVKFEKEFSEFTKNLPRAKFGNKVDWLKAEEEGLLHLKDQLEGITIARKPITAMVNNTQLKSRQIGMPDIIFSHQKHSIWNGCELCHPEIFGVRKGATRYTMQDIFNGKFCGACHGKVAFPNTDCRLCHTKEV